MELLDLPQEDKNAGKKAVKVMSSVTYEIILPAHANISPNEIEIVFDKGWSKIISETSAKPKRDKPKFTMGKQETIF